MQETANETQLLEQSVSNFNQIIETLNSLEEELTLMAEEAEKSNKFQIN